MMIIEYLCQHGHLQQKGFPGARILNREHVNSIGDVIPEPDLTSSPTIIRALFNALKAAPTVGLHKKISFNTNDAVIKVDGRPLQPGTWGTDGAFTKTDVRGESVEVQAFFNTIYPDENAPAVRLFKARQILKSPGGNR